MDPYSCCILVNRLRQVSEEDLDAFAASYRGSEEEARNLKEEYRRRKGNMNV